MLGISELISRKDHRCSAAAHQDSDGISHHLIAELPDHGIIRGTFNTAVPAAVIIGSVRIVPSVCLIVLVIVGKQIIQSKAVMTGYEVHRGSETVVVLVIEIGGSHDPGGCILGIPIIPLEKVSEGITVAAVPLRPPVVCRKTADLIDTARIPGLCDQFCLRQHRIL